MNRKSVAIKRRKHNTPTNITFTPLSNFGGFSSSTYIITTLIKKRLGKDDVFLLLTGKWQSAVIPILVSITTNHSNHSRFPIADWALYNLN